MDKDSGTYCIARWNKEASRNYVIDQGGLALYSGGTTRHPLNHRVAGSPLLPPPES